MLWGKDKENILCNNDFKELGEVSGRIALLALILLKETARVKACALTPTLFACHFQLCVLSQSWSTHKYPCFPSGSL